MDYYKIFLLMAIICYSVPIVNLLRFRREVKNFDEGQEPTDKVVQKWNKLLYQSVFFGGVGIASSVMTFIFKIL